MSGWIDEFLERAGGTPESILPSQLIRNLDYTAEIRLVFAVLEDAIRVYVKYDPIGRKPPIYFDTLEWFYSDGWWPFSFLAVCQILDIEPGKFRQRLRERKVVNPIRRQAVRAA